MIDEVKQNGTCSLEYKQFWETLKLNHNKNCNNTVYTDNTAFQQGTDRSHNPQEIYVTGDGRTFGNVWARNKNGYWGYVCDDHWGKYDATLACRLLGKKAGSKVDYKLWKATDESFFGEVNPQYFAFDDVGCTKDDTETGEKLADCYHNTEHNCASSEAAGVICYVDQYQDGTNITSIDLQGGNGVSFKNEDGTLTNESYLAGNVFIRNPDKKNPQNHNLGYVGPVCDYYWTDNEAQVVCEELFKAAASKGTVQGTVVGRATRRSRYGQVPQEFAYKRIWCKPSKHKCIQPCSESDCDKECTESNDCWRYDYYSTLDEERYCNSTYAGAGVECYLTKESKFSSISFCLFVF